MKPTHQNLSVGVRSRSVWIAAAALLSSLSVVGVLAKPVLGLGRAEVQRTEAKKNAQACQLERTMLRRYEDAHGWERTAAALRSLSTKLPTDPLPIELHGVLRMLADVHRIALSSAGIADAKPTSFAVLEDRVMMREVDLRGTGALADWTGLIDDLERCGYPTSVLELSLQRKSVQDPHFEVHAMLGVYSSRPAPPEKTLAPEKPFAAEKPVAAEKPAAERKPAEEQQPRAERKRAGT